MNLLPALGIPAGIILALLLVPVPKHQDNVSPRHLSRRPNITPLPPSTPRPAPGAVPELVTELAEHWGQIFGVPRAWIRSQSFEESGNVPYRVNERTNATGVMQILPKSATWLVTSLAKSRFFGANGVREILARKWHGKPERDLLDPELNIMLAAYYLAILKAKFGDSHERVAAAYNAGPTIIATAIRRRRPWPKRALVYLSMVADAKAQGFT